MDIARQECLLDGDRAIQGHAGGYGDGGHKTSGGMAFFVCIRNSKLSSHGRLVSRCTRRAEMGGGMMTLEMAGAASDSLDEGVGG